MRAQTARKPMELGKGFAHLPKPSYFVLCMLVDRCESCGRIRPVLATSPRKQAVSWRRVLATSPVLATSDEPDDEPVWATSQSRSQNSPRKPRPWECPGRLTIAKTAQTTQKSPSQSERTQDATGKPRRAKRKQETDPRKRESGDRETKRAHMSPRTPKQTRRAQVRPRESRRIQAVTG